MMTIITDPTLDDPLWTKIELLCARTRNLRAYDIGAATINTRLQRNRTANSMFVDSIERRNFCDRLRFRLCDANESRLFDKQKKI